MTDKKWKSVKKVFDELAAAMTKVLDSDDDNRTTEHLVNEVLRRLDPNGPFITALRCSGFNPPDDFFYGVK